MSHIHSDSRRHLTFRIRPSSLSRPAFGSACSGRSWRLCAAAALSLTSVGAAHADERVDCAHVRCFDLGLRTGVGIVVGGLTASGMVPPGPLVPLVTLEADAGYRLAGVVTLGLAATYARAFLPRSSLATAAATGDGPCFEGTACSAVIYRVGLQARVHLAPHGSIDPWIGIGAGYEFLTVSESGQTQTPQGPVRFDAVALTLRGFEYGRLELGAEGRIGASFALGPFLSLSVAGYNASRASGAVSVGNSTAQLDGRNSREIVTPYPHGWLVFGVRGAFELGGSAHLQPLLPAKA